MNRAMVVLLVLTGAAFAGWACRTSLFPAAATRSAAAQEFAQARLAPPTGFTRPGAPAAPPTSTAPSDDDAGWADASDSGPATPAPGVQPGMPNPNGYAPNGAYAPNAGRAPTGSLPGSRTPGNAGAGMFPPRPGYPTPNTAPNANAYPTPNNAPAAGRYPTPNTQAAPYNYPSPTNVAPNGYPPTSLAPPAGYPPTSLAAPPVGYPPTSLAPPAAANPASPQMARTPGNYAPTNPGPPPTNGAVSGYATPPSYPLPGGQAAPTYPPTGAPQDMNAVTPGNVRVDPNSTPPANYMPPADAAPTSPSHIAAPTYPGAVTPPDMTVPPGLTAPRATLPPVETGSLPPPNGSQYQTTTPGGSPSYSAANGFPTVPGPERTASRDPAGSPDAGAPTNGAAARPPRRAPLGATLIPKANKPIDAPPTQAEPAAPAGANAYPQTNNVAPEMNGAAPSAYPSTAAPAYPATVSPYTMPEAPGETPPAARSPFAETPVGASPLAPRAGGGWDVSDYSAEAPAAGTAPPTTGYQAPTDYPATTDAPATGEPSGAAAPAATTLGGLGVTMPGQQPTTFDAPPAASSNTVAGYPDATTARSNPQGAETGSYAPAASIGAPSLAPQHPTRPAEESPVISTSPAGMNAAPAPSPYPTTNDAAPYEASPGVTPYAAPTYSAVDETAPAAMNAYPTTDAAAANPYPSTNAYPATSDAPATNASAYPSTSDPAPVESSPYATTGAAPAMDSTVEASPAPTTAAATNAASEDTGYRPGSVKRFRRPGSKSAPPETPSSDAPYASAAPAASGYSPEGYSAPSDSVAASPTAMAPPAPAGTTFAVAAPEATPAYPATSAYPSTPSYEPAAGYAAPSESTLPAEAAPAAPTTGGFVVPESFNTAPPAATSAPPAMSAAPAAGDPSRSSPPPLTAAPVSETGGGYSASTPDTVEKPANSVIEYQPATGAPTASPSYPNASNPPVDEAMTRTAPPAGVAPGPTSFPQPNVGVETHLEQVAGATVIARVNGDVILASEVLPMVDHRIAQVADKIPASQKDEARKYLCKQMLEPLIQRKLVYLDAKSDIPKANFPLVEKSLNDSFEERLEEMLAEQKLTNREQLEKKFAEIGSSLDRQRRNYQEMILYQQWLNKATEVKDNVTRDELLKWYQDHHREYEKDARVKYEELMVSFKRHPTKDAAYQAIVDMGNRVAAGEPLAEVAKKSSHGLTASKGGLHEWTMKGSLKSKEIDEALFTLPVNTLSPTIFESDLGFHIVRVVEREEAGATPFRETQKEIREKILASRKKEAQEKYLKGLRENAQIWTIFDDETATAALPPAPDQPKPR